MAKVRVAGAWSGILEVNLDQWTVSMLRQEIANRANTDPNLINLIAAGKILKHEDGSHVLTQIGMKNNSKVLATRVSPPQEVKTLDDNLTVENERSSRLARIKAAATAMSKRHADGTLLPVENFNIELENQNGFRVSMGSETDQQAIMMGLMLHANGKSLMKQENYKDAIEVLSMGDEAFSLCDPSVIDMVDNPSMLQIDMVWCYFMLKDIDSLAVAGFRLKKARQGLERAYGENASRVRLIQGGRYPERAFHLRLELLEGVVAYHSGKTELARRVLLAAQEKLRMLEVSDESLSIVMSMGFKEADAKRALRMSNQDVSGAVEFLVEQKAKRERQREDDLKRQREISEQRTYGVTASNKAVDLERLNELVSIGFEREMGAEALRRNENDVEKTLIDLTSPEGNATIQERLALRKRKRERQVMEASVEQLVNMGFERALVNEALQGGGSIEEVVRRILVGQASSSSSAPASQSEAISSDDNNGKADADRDIANSLASVVENNQTGEAAGGSTSASVAGGSRRSASEERDSKVENELAEELLGHQDAFSDYDIEVTKEGEAIGEYLALLDSMQ